MKKIVSQLLILACLGGPLVAPAAAADTLTREQLQVVSDISVHPYTDWPKLLRQQHRYLDNNVVQYIAGRSVRALNETDRQGRPQPNHHDAYFFALLADSIARELHQPVIYRLQLADVYWKRGDGSEAFDLLDNILVTDRGMPQPWVLGGNYLMQIGNYEEARIKFEKALALDRESEEPLQHVAEIYMFEKQYPKAQQAVDRLLASHPNNSKGLEIKAQLTEQKNHITDTTPVTQGYQPDPDAQKLFLDAQAKSYGGQPNEAETELREAVQKDPKFTGAFSLLGDVLMRQSKWVDAATAYNQAISLDKSSAENWRSFGLANEKAFDDTKNTEYLTHSLQGYQEAVRLQPANPQYLTDLKRASSKQ